jgi:hypothetical protein
MPLKSAGPAVGACSLHPRAARRFAQNRERMGIRLLNRFSAKEAAVLVFIDCFH